MRVERFSLFFPPRLAGIKIGETDYAIGAIPAGGYVKITGMTMGEIKDMDLRLAAHAYCLQPPWKRVAVILAGPGVNVLIALVLFWVVLVAGNPDGATTLANLNPSIETVVVAPTVQSIIEKTPAAGQLRPGDRILAVDGQRASVATIRAAIAHDFCAGHVRAGCRATRPVDLTVRRAGTLHSISLSPEYNGEAKRMLLGFQFGVRAKQFGAVSAAGVVGREVAASAASLVSGLGRALTTTKGRKQLSSIVGITRVTQEAVAGGWGYGFVILGFVSLALAVLNLFPFLPLDGGHIVWAIAEKLRGGRISMEAMMRFSAIGIVLLLFLVANGFYNDLTRLGV
jgi:regulator of sigma E protease